MSATDELRRALDKRGVEWKAPASYDGSTRYDTIVDGYWFHEYDGRITVHGLTTEQAIAATLGPRACHNTHEARWFRCSACGFGIDDMYVTDEGEYPPADQPRYCPNCGRRIEVDG